jgi:hypothetical protein
MRHARKSSFRLGAMGPIGNVTVAARQHRFRWRAPRETGGRGLGGWSVLTNTVVDHARLPPSALGALGQMGLRRQIGGGGPRVPRVKCGRAGDGPRVTAEVTR